MNLMTHHTSVIQIYYRIAEVFQREFYYLCIFPSSTFLSSIELIIEHMFVYYKASLFWSLIEYTMESR